ncbi:MAG: hypothetical protein PHH28_03370 [Desulfuromonadaceae bacterium]|nr:hypothetical protein [Desulfuromonadaceae bacterium]
MDISDLYKLTFEEFRAFVLKDKTAAKILIGSEDRFNMLKVVTANNSRLKNVSNSFLK